jgi:hypothetical protein
MTDKPDGEWREPLKCDRCDRAATNHIFDPSPGAENVARYIHLCDKHAQEYLAQLRRDPPGDQSDA